jgi:hypothetical protein
MIVSAESEEEGNLYALDGGEAGLQVTPDGTFAYATTNYGFQIMTINSYDISAQAYPILTGGPWIDLAIDFDATPHTIFLLSSTSVVSTQNFEWPLDPIQPQRLIKREENLLVVGTNGFQFGNTLGSEVDPSMGIACK